MIKLDVLGNFDLIMSDLALVRVKLQVGKLSSHKYVNAYCLPHVGNILV